MPISGVISRSQKPALKTGSYFWPPVAKAVVKNKHAIKIVEKYFIGLNLFSVNSLKKIIRI
jgi:hypothetical protein